MKSKAKSKILILITLGILFALLPMITINLNFITGNSNKSSDYSDKINLDNKNLKISAVSGKIYINGSSEWLAFKNDGNCTGLGTYSDPYVIEDLVIDGGGSGCCIWIENSAMYFKIENCTVFNSGADTYYDAGIRLLSTTKGTLINNNCSHNYNGIHLENSNNNTVSGNTANNNSHIGIYLIDSNNNNISGNTAAINNYFGIHLWYSDNNNISGNTINNNYIGIYLLDSNNNNISGNTINNNSIGIRLFDSHDNTISENIFNNNRVNISIFYSNPKKFLCPPGIMINVILILITMVIAGMIFVDKKVFKDRVEVHPSMFWITALIFDIIGLIFIAIFFSYFISNTLYDILYSIPFTILAIISSYAGYKLMRDTAPRLAKIGLLLGVILFFINIWPILYIILDFMAMSMVG